MKLKNKGGVWQFNETTWTMPVEGSEGNIGNKDANEVLGLRKVIVKSGAKVEMQSRNKTISDVQQWLIGKMNEDGWFTIVNSKSKLVLTAQTSAITAVTGKL